MATTFGKPTLAQRVLPLFQGFDGWLVAVILLLAAAGLLAMYSSGYDHGTRFADHGRNMLIAVSILFMVAQIPPQKLMAMAVPLYALGVALLVAVAHLKHLLISRGCPTKRHAALAETRR